MNPVDKRRLLAGGQTPNEGGRKLLNVGGGTSPHVKQFAEYHQDLLDIDKDVNPKYCLDATQMRENMPAEEYDVVHCSHCLEHFYLYQVDIVLKGFLHVLNADGFADIIVPSVQGVVKGMVERNLDIHDVWYRTGENMPVTFHDVLYGWHSAIYAGKPYYAHKCGFTAGSLSAALYDAGFRSIWVANKDLDLHAIAHKKEGVPCPSAT